MTSKQLPDIVRLTNISGYEQRCNDIVYCRPQNVTENSSLCVFFGGDVQDFTENMLSHRDNKNYVQWNLENTAKILQHRFLNSHIVVIRPVRMEYKTFSCYENFLPCFACGVPNHCPMNFSLKHLELLLLNISRKLQTMTDEELRHDEEVSKNGLVDEVATPKTSDEVPLRTAVNLNDCEVSVIGFSKGCVVLNQFLYEFNYYKNLTDSKDIKILPLIKQMYWLDGGHSGGKNTWITTRSLLETLATMDIQVYVHVSPYQVADERRPWVKNEEKKFTETLKKLGANIERTLHFSNLPSSLHVHFNILKEF
ncbi:mitochondrial protein C2orf69 [Diabrotica virgifera virgifera]|uniref:Uncharacterized protein n=1 Tax=Diabrotica virgifera virgifera TaxID=50390 RepID=A0ABM5KZY2_DIAVI|nr:mitochondrial protein C2orf69 [Diabrotica virgifera virgifera]XP_050515747.1 mitochondrial protein C2orf69 [Diabrotica virgifera virgifera]